MFLILNIALRSVRPSGRTLAADFENNDAVWPRVQCEPPTPLPPLSAPNIRQRRQLCQVDREMRKLIVVRIALTSRA